MAKRKRKKPCEKEPHQCSHQWENLCLAKCYPAYSHYYNRKIFRFAKQKDVSYYECKQKEFTDGGVKLKGLHVPPLDDLSAGRNPRRFQQEELSKYTKKKREREEVSSGSAKKKAGELI